MKLYELPMQENGRVILPAELRKALGLAKGDKVMLEAEGDQVTLTTARLRRKRAQEIAKRYARPGVSVVDDPLNNSYPTPLESTAQDDVFVGRARRDASHPNGLVYWCVTDNLVKGAALNMIQMVEWMQQDGIL